MGIGKALKRLRMEKKLTQKELAAMVSGGLDYTYIGKIEREEQLPSLKILIKISEALAAPLSSFFTAENENPTNSRFQKVVDLAAVREMSQLNKELNQLHRDDIPLLTEIIQAINRNRKNRKKDTYRFQENDHALVAEKDSPYEGDE
nr:helix-turn-helix transcriptional regulator [Pelotalea chapellei]